MEDEGKLNIEKSLPEIKKMVMDKFANKKFTYIFTHGYNGAPFFLINNHVLIGGQPLAVFSGVIDPLLAAKK